MTLPIYRQTRQDIPCEWVYDDEQDEPQEPSRRDTYIGFVWAALLGLTILALEYAALMGVHS